MFWRLHPPIRGADAGSIISVSHGRRFDGEKSATRVFGSGFIRMFEGEFRELPRHRWHGGGGSFPAKSPLRNAEQYSRRDSDTFDFRGIGVGDEATFENLGWPGLAVIKAAKRQDAMRSAARLNYVSGNMPRLPARDPWQALPSIPRLIFFRGARWRRDSPAHALIDDTLAL